LEQLRQLFQGQSENWETWGGLPGTPQLISREEAAGEYAFFQHHVMGDTRVTLTSLLAPSNNAVLELVHNDPLAIGYVSTVYLDDQVRAVALEGVPPAPEAVAADLYPLSRSLYLVTQEEPQNASRDFVQWILTPQGQEIVTAHHLIPASP
jgi:phosphate transport system substrate-binding protein